ncbi:MAG: AAA family ATPase, partial [Nitrospirae bacterium]|nr:AAA family ATPase [Nitrospirota bacterium]
TYKNLIFVFDTKNLLQKLENIIKANPVDLIIVDTFLDLFSGEMNQSNRIRSYLNNYHLLAKKYQCLVLMLHHTGKRTEDLYPSKNNLLGSQGFEAKMRLVLELRLDRESSEFRHLCILKGNYLPKEYKDSSYKLRFDSNMLFEDTGEKVPFEGLAGTRKDREAEKQAWIKIALPLVKENKPYEEISKVLKEQGFFVSKSTIHRVISEIIKNRGNNDSKPPEPADVPTK